MVTGPRRALAAGPDAAAGPARRRDRVRDRRRGDLRAAARVDAQAPPRAHARGRGRHERPGRRAARARLHRVDPASRTTACSTWRCCSSQQLGIGARRRRRRRLAGRAGVPPRASSRPAGCTRSPRWRSSRSPSARADVAARLGLSRRLPRGPGDGLGVAARAPDRARLPRRPGLGRAAGDVPRARPARLPARARRLRAGRAR